MPAIVEVVSAGVRNKCLPNYMYFTYIMFIKAICREKLIQRASVSDRNVVFSYPNSSSRICIRHFLIKAIRNPVPTKSDSIMITILNFKEIDGNYFSTSFAFFRPNNAGVGLQYTSIIDKDIILIQTESIFPKVSFDLFGEREH